MRLTVPIEVKMDMDEIIERLKKDDFVRVVRCKDCRWFNCIGCAIRIVDETEKPKENDFCSFGERMEDEDGEVYQSIRHQEGVRPVP